MKMRIVLLFTALAILASVLLSQKTPPEKVRLQTLRSVTVYTTVNCQGTLEPRKTVTLGIPGIAAAEEIFVGPGDRVKRGQLLLTYRKRGNEDPSAGMLIDLLAGQMVELGVAAALPDLLSAHDGCLEAPFDGKILQINAAEGAETTSLFGAVQLCDDSRMFARLRVSEVQLVELQPGMPVTVTGDTFEGTRHGVVIETSPQVKTRFSLSGAASNYGEVLCELYDCSDLPAGATLSASIATGKIKNAITVPYSAIDQDEDGMEYVCVLKNGRSMRRNITTAEDLGDQVRVSSGLCSGDVLILERLPEGTEVSE